MLCKLSKFELESRKTLEEVDASLSPQSPTIVLCVTVVLVTVEEISEEVDLG